MHYRKQMRHLTNNCNQCISVNKLDTLEKMFKLEQISLQAKYAKTSANKTNNKQKMHKLK